MFTIAKSPKRYRWYYHEIAKKCTLYPYDNNFRKFILHSVQSSMVSTIFTSYTISTVPSALNYLLFIPFITISYQFYCCATIYNSPFF